MSPRTRFLAAGLLVAVPFGGPATVGTFTSDGDSEVAAEVVVTFQDDDIDESSGLVVRGDRLYTVNDSGDGAVVYEVDLESGETTGVTSYTDEEPEDVEALAPGPGGTLWVGDIGDNRRARGSIRLYRVVPATGGGTVPAEPFDLVYPNRGHDAEALLVHPRTGEVLVVTKQFGRGAVYRAPRRLVRGATHQLERVAAAPGTVTDGAFLADGEQLLLRTYGSASLYAYPGFERLGDFALPKQEQGEAIAVGDDGRVYLSSEGKGSDVLAMELPRVAAPGAAPTPDRQTPPREYDPKPWMGLGPVGLLVTVVGLVLTLLLVRAFLRRSRHTP